MERYLTTKIAAMFCLSAFIVLLLIAYLIDVTIDNKKTTNSLAQCVDLLDIEHDASAICLDVLGYCVEDIGDMVYAREIVMPETRVNIAMVSRD